MIIIYETQLLFEAQWVQNELTAAGMKVHISGEFLGGAVGDLPPTDAMIKVWLYEEQHEQRARQIIEKLEASRKTAGPDKPCLQCGELLSPHFERCWQCDTWRTDI